SAVRSRRNQANYCAAGRSSACHAATCSARAARQTLAVLSSLQVTIRRPSGEKVTDLTQVRCPLRVRSSRPLTASHILAVLSQLPVTIRWPSGEKATDQT